MPTPLSRYAVAKPAAGGKNFGKIGQQLKKSTTFMSHTRLLRQAGVSRNKILALKDLAAHHIQGFIPTKKQFFFLTDQEIIARLTEIKGIGPWTVQMLLIFRLARLDVLPSTDFWVRKGFCLAYKKRVPPSPRELEAWGERWKPFRTIAALYLWRVADRQNCNADASW